MSSTLIRIVLFNLVFGLLITPLYLVLKTQIFEFLFLYVPLLSIVVAAYMDATESKQTMGEQ